MTSASNEVSLQGRKIQFIRLAGSPGQELNMTQPHMVGFQLITEKADGILWAVLWDDRGQVPKEIRRYNMAHCATVQWEPA